MTAWTHEGTLAALGADATALAGQPSFAGNTQVGSMRAAPFFCNRNHDQRCLFGLGPGGLSPPITSSHQILASADQTCGMEQYAPP